MKRISKSNQGMTLVELLVSVAVLSILMGGAMALMRQAATYHGQSSREVEIQNQLQTAFVQISNLMIDANIGIEYDSSRERMISCHNDFYYVVEKHDEKLYVDQVNYTSAATTVDMKLQEARTYVMTPTDNHLLSDRVATFLVDTSGQDEGYVVLAMRCTYQNRTAYLSQNVFLRNSDSGSTILAGGTHSVTLNAQPCPSDATIYYVDISSLVGKNIASIQMTGANTSAATVASLYQTGGGVNIDSVTNSTIASLCTSLGVSCTTNAEAVTFDPTISFSGNYMIITMNSANKPNQVIVTYKEPED